MPESDASRLASLEALSARLDERSASLLRELKRLTGEFDRLGTLSGDTIKWGAGLHALEQDFSEFKTDFGKWKESVETELKTKRPGMSATVKITLIAASATVAAALIAAIAQIASSG